MTLPQNFIGVDVAKDWIDVFCFSTRKRERILTTKQALARFARAAHTLHDSVGLEGAFAFWPEPFPDLGRRLRLV